MTQFGRMWWLPLLQWLFIGTGTSLQVQAWSFGPAQSNDNQDTGRVPQPSDVGSTANHTSKWLPLVLLPNVVLWILSDSHQF